ncbi:MAG: hypothetical protein F4011_03865 [Acidimicrobiaceae bacterium]|nr:hypothetical protein [Acidimicrobiaceae bacterium]MYL03304.1 hypothetical protein [Acidimicrobiaceae bacterium]
MPGGPNRSCPRAGRAADRGLITLEWLLIVGAIAGLAASSVLIVQRVVDDQTDVPDDPLVRMLEADIAAAAVAAEAQAVYDDNRFNYVHQDYADRCNGISTDFSDVVVDDGVDRWVGPEGPDGLRGHPGRRDPVHRDAAAGPRDIGGGGGCQRRGGGAREQGLGPGPPR